MKNFHPILSLAQSQKFESELLGNSTEKSYLAMEKAGLKIAEMFLIEFGNKLSKTPEILALIGTGHNGGDTLIALRKILSEFPSAKISLVLGNKNKLKPNTKLALEKLHIASDNVSEFEISALKVFETKRFDVLFDGILGMSYTPPLRAKIAEEIELANKINAKVRASIDIPSGASNEELSPIFKADVTYATGIFKDVLLEKFNRDSAGRIRYADIGFFDSKTDEFSDAKKFTPSENALKIFSNLRPTISDKRSYGHLFIIAGSKRFPGAAMLATKSALRAGVGLVSTFVPESLAPTFSAQEPSAIWNGCPEDESGAISLEALSQIRSRLPSATALLIGSGLTTSRETRVLIQEMLKITPELPVILDADAIYSETVELLKSHNAPALLTPHEGEFLRIASDVSDSTLLDCCKKYNASIALKSPITRISDGEKIVYQPRGCPALARGGSGDILAGLCGAIMANKSLSTSALQAGSLASMWLGISAEMAASEYGETAIASSDIIKFIHKAIR